VNINGCEQKLCQPKSRSDPGGLLSGLGEYIRWPLWFAWLGRSIILAAWVGNWCPGNKDLSSGNFTGLLFPQQIKSGITSSFPHL